VCWLLIVLAGASAAAMDDGRLYAGIAGGQAAFYLCAAAGAALRPVQRRSMLLKLLANPIYFFLSNAAALRAWVEVFEGRRIDIWESKRSAGVKA
jgi:hypothetical protein